MKLEFHQLDRRYEHLRVRNPERQRRLIASLASSGQQTPIVVIAVGDARDRYLVIDGHKRVAALEQLGGDTVEAIVWEMDEADALVLDRSMRFSEPETALEQGWLLAELERRFGYTLDDLARRFDRSVSWVSRRLALVELLPETIQQQVRTGGISAHVAMKYLVPMARTDLHDCQRMANVFAKHRFSSRQAGQLYEAWRDASGAVRQRILDSPDLFLKAQQQVEPEPSSKAEELLRDLTMVLSITNRAGRRLAPAAPLIGASELETARRKVECAMRDLTVLAERIAKELEHVESKSTDRHSGTSRPGNLHTPDRTLSESVPADGAQSSPLELVRVAGAGAARESRSAPQSDSGVVGDLQRQSRPGP
jgi:ParB family chromosome partitioning protein